MKGEAFPRVIHAYSATKTTPITTQLSHLPLELFALSLKTNL